MRLICIVLFCLLCSGCLIDSVPASGATIDPVDPTEIPTSVLNTSPENQLSLTPTRKPTTSATEDTQPTPSETASLVLTETAQATVLSGNASVNTSLAVAPGELLFLRQERAFEYELRAINVVEGAERLITSITSPTGRASSTTALEARALSPDSRYLAVADGPGLLILDLVDGIRYHIIEGDTTHDARNFAWAADSSGVYFSPRSLINGRYQLRYLAMPPGSTPSALVSESPPPDSTGSTRPEWSGAVLSPLPNGQLLMTQGLVYSPQHDQFTLLPLPEAGTYPIVVDYHPGTGELLSTAVVGFPSYEPIPLYLSRLLPDGTLADTQLVGDYPSDWFVYRDARFLPDGRIVAVVWPVNNDDTEAVPTMLVLIEPRATGVELTVIDEACDAAWPFALLTANSIIATCQTGTGRLKLWVIMLDGSEAPRFLAEGAYPVVVGGPRR